MSQFKQSAICLISNLFNSVSFENRIRARVDTDSIREPFGYSFVDVSLSRIFDSALKKEEACNSHFVHGKGTSLIRANVICTSHSLTSLKEADQVILILHFSNRVSQGNGDS